mmetsp:Transcript_30592/g.72861  ORF Transcript_30592/g.72861 Transcript_30592/m.72861 type:complete len:106 (-) Transcript_30592:718-1035(-)
MGSCISPFAPSSSDCSSSRCYFWKQLVLPGIGILGKDCCSAGQKPCREFSVDSSGMGTAPVHVGLGRRQEQALWARGGRDVAQLAPIGPFADSVASDKLLETGSE